MKSEEQKKLEEELKTVKTEIGGRRGNQLTFLSPHQIDQIINILADNRCSIEVWSDETISLQLSSKSPKQDYHFIVDWVPIVRE